MSSLQRLGRAAMPNHRVPYGSSQSVIPGSQRQQSPERSTFQCPGLELRLTPEPFHLPEVGPSPMLGYGGPDTERRPFPSRSASRRPGRRQAPNSAWTIQTSPRQADNTPPNFWMTMEHFFQ